MVLMPTEPASQRGTVGRYCLVISSFTKCSAHLCHELSPDPKETSVSKALTDRCPYSDPESLNIWLNESFPARYASIATQTLIHERIPVESLFTEVRMIRQDISTGVGLRLPKFKLQSSWYSGITALERHGNCPELTRRNGELNNNFSHLGDSHSTSGGSAPRSMNTGRPGKSKASTLGGFRKISRGEEALFSLFWHGTKQNDVFATLLFWSYIWQFLQYLAPVFALSIPWRWNLTETSGRSVADIVWNCITIQIVSISTPTALWISVGVVSFLIVLTFADAIVAAILFRHDRVFLFPVHVLRYLTVGLSTFLFMPCLGILFSVTSPATTALADRWAFPTLVGCVMSIIAVVIYLVMAAFSSGFQFVPRPKAKQALGRPNAHFDLLLLVGKALAVSLTKFWAVGSPATELALHGLIALLLAGACIWMQPFFRASTNMLFAGGLAVLFVFDIHGAVLTSVRDDRAILPLMFGVAVAVAILVAFLTCLWVCQWVLTYIPCAMGIHFSNSSPNRPFWRARRLWLYRPGQSLSLLTSQIRAKPFAEGGDIEPSTVDLSRPENGMTGVAGPASIRGTLALRESGLDMAPSASDGEGISPSTTPLSLSGSLGSGPLTRNELAAQQAYARRIRKFRAALDVDRATRFLQEKQYRTQQHIAYADRIYQLALQSKHLRYDAGLHARYALFLLAFAKDASKASTYIAKAAALGPSLEYRFLVHGNLKDAEANAVAAKDTVMTMLATKKNAAEAERYHHKVRRHMRDAWGLLLMPHVDVQVLQHELSEAMTAADKAEAAYVQLLEQNPNSISALRAFGALQQEFYGNETLAESLFLHADTLEEEHSKKHGDTDSVSMASTENKSRSSRRRGNDAFTADLHHKKSRTPIYCRPCPQMTFMLNLCTIAVFVVLIIARANLLTMAGESVTIQSISEVGVHVTRAVSLLHMVPFYTNRQLGVMGTVPSAGYPAAAGGGATFHDPTADMIGRIRNETLVLPLEDLLSHVDEALADLRSVITTAVDPRDKIWQYEMQVEYPQVVDGTLTRETVSTILLWDLITVVSDKIASVRSAVADGLFWRDVDLKNMLFLFENAPGVMFRRLVSVAQDYLLATIAERNVQLAVPAIGVAIACILFVLEIWRLFSILKGLKQARVHALKQFLHIPKDVVGQLHERLRMAVAADDGDETDVGSLDDRASVKQGSRRQLMAHQTSYSVGGPTPRDEADMPSARPGQILTQYSPTLQPVPTRVFGMGTGSMPGSGRTCPGSAASRARRHSNGMIPAPPSSLGLVPPFREQEEDEDADKETDETPKKEGDAAEDDAEQQQQQPAAVPPHSILPPTIARTISPLSMGGVAPHSSQADVSQHTTVIMREGPAPSGDTSGRYRVPSASSLLANQPSSGSPLLGPDPGEAPPPIGDLSLCQPLHPSGSPSSAQNSDAVSPHTTTPHEAVDGTESSVVPRDSTPVSDPDHDQEQDGHDEAARAVEELAAAEVNRQMKRISILSRNSFQKLAVGGILFCLVIISVLITSMFLLTSNDGFSHDITASALRGAVLHEVHFSAVQLFANASACSLAASITGRPHLSPEPHSVRAQLLDYMEVLTSLHCLIRFGYGQCNVSVEGHPLLGILKPPGSIDPASQRAKIMYGETTCMMANTTICELFPDRLALPSPKFTLNALVFYYIELAHGLASMHDEDLPAGMIMLDQLTRAMLYDLNGGCRKANTASATNAVNSLYAEADVLGYLMLVMLFVLPGLYGLGLYAAGRHSMLLDWQKTAVVGVRGIDDQHKRLFEYAQQLAHAVINAQDRTTQQRLLEILTHFLSHHATFELRQAKKYHYPEEIYYKHEAEHQSLLAMVSACLPHHPDWPSLPPVLLHCVSHAPAVLLVLSLAQVKQASVDLQKGGDLLEFIKAFGKAVPEHIRQHDLPLGKWITTKGHKAK
ncbi:hypothetical protein PAPYR_4876 [Paratrimastix pyriformis]|uniref:TmcB/TmcC TPR repeats domain-containing protein n=1 Tax=Paratrimastix pyriformis TaxID=342808 RepID=A0ABQ8UQV4_9EUKA|nr:hypothetical protein PAPYR_4876 [Paratrimastix pyriformis]